MRFLRRSQLAIYLVFGAGALLGGIAAILFVGSLPEGGTRSAEERHLVQEFGAALVFVGLMFFWCVVNLERSRGVQYMLIVFFALLSVVHWLDYVRGVRPLMSGLVNTIPTLVLVGATWLDAMRRRHELGAGNVEQ